jgi:hypothetical protein
MRPGTGTYTFETQVPKSPEVMSAARSMHIPSVLGYLDNIAAKQEGGQF